MSQHAEPSLWAAALQRWSGLTLTAVGLAVLGVIILHPTAPESPLTWWIVNRALALQRVLPLIGLGAALSLVSTPAFTVAFFLFLVGVCFGFLAQNFLLTLLTIGPQAALHLFFTGPIASIAVGVALVPGARLRPFVLPAAATVAGIMLSLRSL